MDVKEATTMIGARFSRLESENHYQFLGVAEDADVADIKRIYRGLVRQFHPDSHPNLKGLDVSGQLEAVFKRINEAGRVLADPRRRADYDAELAGAVAGEMTSIFAAEEAFRRGRSLLDRGQYAGALAKLEIAAEVNDDPETQAHYLFARFLNEPVNADGDRGAVATQTHQKLGELADAHKETISPTLFYAKSLKLMGKTDEAKKYFQRVLRMQPKHPDATREIRLIGMRAPTAAPSILDRIRGLFKKG